MKFDRTFLASENDGKLNWDVNNAVMYSVVNKDAVNPYGEYRGYKIMPGKQGWSSTFLFADYCSYWQQKPPRRRELDQAR